MNKSEIADMDIIHEGQVPSIIRDRFTELSVLRENVEEASKKAELAQASAELAKNKSAGIFQKKEAIEALQEAAGCLAEAQISAAQAQEVSFGYQQKLGEITKYLFGLGVTNIAMNRIVVRELELRLNGASEKELDEFARQEIIGVVRQLKAQEDIMKKQGELTERVKEHERKLALCDKKDMEYDRKLKEQGEHEKKQDDLLLQCTRKDKEQDDLIESNKNKIKELDSLLVEKTRKDKNRDKEIARCVAKDEELGKRIDKGEEKGRKQDEEIARRAAKEEELEKRIDECEKKDKNQEKEIARQAAKDEELGKRIDECEEKNRNEDEVLSKLLNELIQSNIEKENQMRELKMICEELSSKMEAGSDHVDSMEKKLMTQMNEKASKKGNIVSYIIGIAALIAVIVQMFIY